jgi:hypothetical protein
MQRVVLVRMFSAQSKGGLAPSIASTRICQCLEVSNHQVISSLILKDMSLIDSLSCIKKHFLITQCYKLVLHNSIFFLEN